MSPEVFSGQGYSFESDIWALGVMMFEFLCNRLPFGQDTTDPYKVIQEIKKETIYYPKQL